MPNSAVAFENEGAVVKILVSSRDTRGDYTVCEIQTTGPTAVPPHLHSYEDQWCHVLEGHFQFVIGGKSVAGGPGTAVQIPRQTSASIASSNPGKLLVIAHPGGLDLFFSDAHAAQTAGSLLPVFEKHGIVIQ
jgi:mannose-6-phosphate isomerase-like protein (cupin superfamily)